MSVSVPSLRSGLGEPRSCYLCGDSLGWDDAVVDHVTPVSRGGSSDPSNLRWTHRQCNKAKSDLTLEELESFARRFLAQCSGGEFASLNFPELKNLFEDTGVKEKEAAP